MKCMVCTTCSGLLLKDRHGLIGACNMFPVKLSVLLNGLMNLSRGMCSVTVPMAKLWWDRLFLSELLQSILGPWDLGLHALDWHAATLIPILALLLCWCTVFKALNPWFTL